MTSKSAAEILIKVGSFAEIESERARLFAGLESIWTAAQRSCEDVLAGQVSMFGDIGDSDDGSINAPPLPTEFKPFTRSEQMALEKDLIGFYLSDHPLDQYADRLRGRITHTCSEARQGEDRETIRIAGVITNSRTYYTKGKNEQMFFLTLEDRTGTIPVTLFPRKAIEFGQFAVKDSVVIVEGVVSHRDRIVVTPKAVAEANGSGEHEDDDSGTAASNGPSSISAEITAEKIEPIAQIAMESIARAVDYNEAAEIARVHIRVDDRVVLRLSQLKSALKSHPGETPVLLHIHENSRERIKIDPLLRVSSDRQVIEYLRSVVNVQGALWTE